MSYAEECREKRYESLFYRTEKRNRIYAHKDRIDDLSGNLRTPITLEIFMTNQCNSKCHFCAYPQKDGIRLNTSSIKEIVDFSKTHRVKGIVFSGGGEPSIHPLLSDTINELSECGIDIGVITNGIYMPPSLLQSYSKCKWIRFSLLSPYAEQYERYTGQPYTVHTQVLENINALRTQSETVIIGATMMVSQESGFLDELLNYIDLAEETGIDQIVISEMQTHIGNFKLDRGSFAKYKYDIEKASRRKRIITNIEKFTSITTEDTSRKREEPCSLVQHGLIGTITPDGNVYPCLGLYNRGEESILGNINQQSLEQIFSAKNINQFYEMLLKTKCRYCKNYNSRIQLEYYLFTQGKRYVNDVHAAFL